MKESENHLVDLFEFSDANEITTPRTEGEINLRLSLAERRMKNERRRQRERFAKMEPFLRSDRSSVDQNGQNYATRFVTEGASGPHLLLTHHL
jgi:hypothetical protein